MLKSTNITALDITKHLYYICFINLHYRILILFNIITNYLTQQDLTPNIL